MTRMSKQSKRRATSPRRNRAPSKKTGAKKDNLPLGYKVQENAFSSDTSLCFIPKI